MKTLEKIFNNETGKIKVAKIYYDEHITKGLLTVSNNSYIKSNVKTCGIKYQIPENKHQIGVRFSKHIDMVIITLMFIAENGKQKKFQFIVKKDLDLNFIYQKKHYITDGLENVLIQAYELLMIETMNDAKQFTSFYGDKNN